MSTKKPRIDHAAERASRRKRLLLQRVLFVVSICAVLAGTLSGLALLTGCVSVHTEDRINVEVNNSAIHVAPKVEVKANDRRHESAI